MSAHRTAATIRFGVLLAILCTAGAAAESDHEPPDPEKLPDPLAVDGDNPFIYVNDQSTDNYNAELALGLANRGRIDLRGFLVGYPREAWRSSEQDREQYREAKEEFVTHHRRVREMAERSGLQNPPPAELGVFKHHARPESGRIEDTEPIGSPGTERIVREARKASREEPLVIAFGIGVLSHLFGDVFFSLVNLEFRHMGFLLWPAIPPIEYEVEQSFAAHFALVDLSPELYFEFLLVALALVAWRSDGYPGLATVLSWPARLWRGVTETD